MKRRYMSLMAGFAVMLLLFTACKKDYYQDSGLAKGKFNGSVLDYLKSKPEYFSNLVKVIGLAKMEEVFQKEQITFFAPSNACFDSTIHMVNSFLYQSGKDTILRMEQVPQQVWRQMLCRYVFKGKYMLNDIPQIDPAQYKTHPGQFYRSYDSQPMNLGVVYNNEGGAQYAGYRQLHIAYAFDIALPPSSWSDAAVASVNIEPDNGAVHVLVYKNHYFGFSPVEFLNLCLEFGIAGK